MIAGEIENGKTDSALVANRPCLRRLLGIYRSIQS